MLLRGAFWLVVVRFVLALNDGSDSRGGLDFTKLRPLLPADRIGSSPVLSSDFLSDPSVMQSSTGNVHRGSYIVNVHLSFDRELM